MKRAQTPAHTHRKESTCQKQQEKTRDWQHLLYGFFWRSVWLHPQITWPGFRPAIEREWKPEIESPYCFSPYEEGFGFTPFCLFKKFDSSLNFDAGRRRARKDGWVGFMKLSVKLMSWKKNGRIVLITIRFDKARRVYKNLSAHHLIR